MNVESEYVWERIGYEVLKQLPSTFKTVCVNGADCIWSEPGFIAVFDGNAAEQLGHIIKDAVDNELAKQMAKR